MCEGGHWEVEKDSLTTFSLKFLFKKNLFLKIKQYVLNGLGVGVVGSKTNKSIQV